MRRWSRREFLRVTAWTGGAVICGPAAIRGLSYRDPIAVAQPPQGDPITIGIIYPLSSPYKTSSSHDVHGATVALDMYNKKGCVLVRPVTLIEADDASNPQTGVKAAIKLIKEDRIDCLMGTFNGDVAL